MRGSTDYYARFDVSDLVVVVTGGTEGIGFGIAEAFGSGGASVVVASRSEEKVRRAEELLSGAGVQSLGIVADVRDPDSVDALFAEVAERFSRLDVLVNSVGGSFGDSYERGPVLTLGVQDFMECYRNNVIAPVLCSKAAVPIMTATGGGGSILHLSSGAGLSATPFRMGAYGASKAALNNLTRTMAMEFAPTVRVNAICPGHTDTPRTTPGRTPEHIEKAKQNSASGRIGSPADIAGVACFLASPAASWVNAQVFSVDGGSRGRL